MVYLVFLGNKIVISGVFQEIRSGISGVFQEIRSGISGVFQEIRSGISGIEKHLQRKAEKDTQSISKAFQDLDRLNFS